MYRKGFCGRQPVSQLRTLHFELLEDRIVLNGDPQVPLPTKVGESFLIDDWDNDVTTTHFGNNYFGGNNGRLLETEVTLSAESNSPVGGSLSLKADPNDDFGGYFTSLGGRNEVKVVLNPADSPTTVPIPDSFLDFDDIYGGFGPLVDRSVEELQFDVKHDLSEPLIIKIEINDQSARRVEALVEIPNTGGLWSTAEVSFDNDFSGASDFNWNQVTTLVLVIEGFRNPSNWELLVDNLRLVDTDGAYPDLNAISSPGENPDDPTDDELLPQYTDAFLDYVRWTSSQFFWDFRSTFPGTGGIIQDRSTFSDLLTVGGVGFQLNSYAIAAEHGYVSREVAAELVNSVLSVLADQDRQGPEAIGNAGYRGFFYHFLGTDGLRKHNFDFEETPQDESTNTIELSTIDTALAVAGVISVGQYFDGDSPVEQQIRDRAIEIYARVEWPFLLFNNPDNPNDVRNNQFYLGWKPNESRDDFGPFGRFLLEDADGLGSYSSRNDGGEERPATIDYYTDEGLLIALLAMGAPNPEFRLGPEVWYSMIREDDGGSFVKTFPGSLFTYQFASAWLDTEPLGFDNHPTKPVDFFQNTRSAIQATRDYAIENPNDRATWRDGKGETHWGISAADGPVEFSDPPGGSYSAYAARTAALELNSGDPLEIGVTTVYGAGSSMVHEPELATEALWAMAREDLNQDGTPDLLHPRFGFVDAFTLDIADAEDHGVVDTSRFVRSTVSGPWSNLNAFAIDNGPMIAMIDNHLEDQLIPNLFMSHPTINAALRDLFFTTDYNSDGIVNASDYIVWRNTVGSTTDMRADGNRDNSIDQEDYELWRMNYGRTRPAIFEVSESTSQPSNSASIPVLITRPDADLEIIDTADTPSLASPTRATNAAFIAPVGRIDHRPDSSQLAKSTDDSNIGLIGTRGSANLELLQMKSNIRELVTGQFNKPSRQFSNRDRAPLFGGDNFDAHVFSCIRSIGMLEIEEVYDVGSE
jgi:hypothetical protein